MRGKNLEKKGKPGKVEVEREAGMRRSHRMSAEISRSKRGKKRNTGKSIPINKAEHFY